MELDFTFFAVAIPAVMYAGIDKAGFGSSASVAAAAILALILEPTQAVAIMLPLLIVMDFVAIRPNWKKWAPGPTRILVMGTTAGVLVGAGLIFVISDDVFRLLIGMIALAFVAFQACRRAGLIKPLAPFSDRVGFFFGVGAGTTSFIAHSGGPVSTIFLLSRDLRKVEFQATTVVVFWINNILKLGMYLALGILTLETSVAALYLVPFAILGTLLGVRLNQIVPEKVYFAFIYVFLTFAGTKLMYDALV